MSATWGLPSSPSSSTSPAQFEPDIARADAALQAWVPSRSLANELVDWLGKSGGQGGHGGDPDRHAIRVKPSDWSKVAGDDWPQRLGDTGERLCVSRAVLFEIAEESRATGSWSPLLTASFAWGYGNVGYGPSRLAKILNVNGRGHIRKALDAAVAELDRAGAEAGPRQGRLVGL